MKIGPKYKIARRLGERIFPKTQTAKFTISGSERGGKTGGGRPKALSDYGRQLIEKQKARYTYGVTEGQFRGYVEKARHVRGAGRATELYRLLETRLDNVIFRLGIANSRRFARQLVSHGHLLVNGRKVNIPSCSLKTGDKIRLREGSKNIAPFRELTEKLAGYQLPEWLKGENGSWEVVGMPTQQTGELNLNFGTIIEFYSRV